MEDLHLWQSIANQGFPVLLLTLGIWWFNKKNTSQEDKIEKLYQQINESHIEDKKRLFEVLDRHSDAMDRLTETAEKIVLLIKQ